MDFGCMGANIILIDCIYLYVVDVDVCVGFNSRSLVRPIRPDTFSR